jgi:CDGSH-type Zn-finger protein
MADNPNPEKVEPKIEIMEDGEYRVSGDVLLVHKTQVVSEYGEPLTWKKDKVYETPRNGKYRLCRCGHSKDKPFVMGLTSR